MKQLTVYDAIRTHHRDVVRWQVRDAIELALKRLAMPTTPGGLQPAVIANVKRRARQRAMQKRSKYRVKKYAVELARLKANVRSAVLQLLGPERLNQRLRVIEGGKQ